MVVNGILKWFSDKELALIMLVLKKRNNVPFTYDMLKACDVNSLARSLEYGEQVFPRYRQHLKAASRKLVNYRLPHK